MEYKIPLTLDEQINYLHHSKRIQFNIITEEQAKEILMRYGYINVITPFKYKFARLDRKHRPIKDDYGHNIYDRNIEFSEYYSLFIEERIKYPTIAKNVILFETQFKSILTYHVLTENKINDYDSLHSFLETIRLNLSKKENYSAKRMAHMIHQILKAEKTIDNYHSVYSFFDHLSLGTFLTIFIGLDINLQNQIFEDCKKVNLSFNVDKTPDFINKIFTLISIRNCIVHGNSLEILVKFYNPKNKTLRDSTNKKRFVHMIQYLSKEKSHSSE